MSCRCEKDYLCIECASRKSAEDALAAAQAQAAELRRALEFLHEQLALDPVSGRLYCGDSRQVAELERTISAALSISPGEALERIKRQARIVALEALPCGYACATEPTTCIDTGVEERFMCPRCRALNAAKGGA